MITFSRKLGRSNFAAIGISLFVLLSFPILLPCGIGLNIWNRRKLERAIAQCRCPKCGEKLSMESLALADSRWKSHINAIKAEHPGVRFRIARSLDAVCVRCGVGLVYDWQGARLDVRPSLDSKMSLKDLQEGSA